MKALHCVLLLACLPFPARAEESPKLKVHEWGTMTVLSGSDGMPLAWYQTFADTDPLPAFVLKGMAGGKAGYTLQRSLVRMETPVLYFYPERAMRVRARVQFANGEITEWFPAPRNTIESLFRKDPIMWEGDLLPPDDMNAKAQIPDVAEGRGSHYRHARDVPAAWIFRSSIAAERFEKDPAEGKDADRFIFYRGKGDAALPYAVEAASDGMMSLKLVGMGHAISTAFALTVKGDAARWSRMPRLEAVTPENASALKQSESVSRPNPAEMPVARAADELAAVMRQELTAAGLTPDEARAMVATWDDDWFREPGSRVLAILPHEWIDEVLPLSISPTPTQLTRVFVARFEVLTPDREAELASILSGNADDAAQASRLGKLELGRFANGALVRAQAMQSQRMNERFNVLRKAAAHSSTDGKHTAVR